MSKAEIITALADLVVGLAAEALAEVAQSQPTLGFLGWDLDPPIIVDEPHSIVQFAIARAWLSQLKRSKTSAVSSYFCKHLAEADAGIWFANGTFVAAAIASGIKQQRGERDSPNSMLAVKPPRGWGALL